ncbi:hypothetical protein LTR94_022285, partial [Friedmanniomyces endolithicus]
MPAYILAAIAALVPGIAAQAQTSYVDYLVQPQPSLDQRTVATITDGFFPDCVSGPLSKTVVCNSSLSALERATALVSMFTLEEL